MTSSSLSLGISAIDIAGVRRHEHEMDQPRGELDTGNNSVEHHRVNCRGLPEKIFKLILAEEEDTFGLAILRLLAGSIALPYAGLVKMRNRLFDFGVLESHRLDCRVISVGNLVLGGTGKTPLVLWLARFLVEQGWRVAVVSRGYRGGGGRPVLMVSDGHNILADSCLSGDEPHMIAKRLPGVPVVCSPKRVLAAQAAIDKFQSQVVILDDGFQHRVFGRDLDVVILDARNPSGNGRLFPRGNLREGETALARAQILVLSRFDGSRQAVQNREELSRKWPGKAIFTATHRPERLFEAITGRELGLGSLTKKRTAAFAGIGRPDHFFQSLAELGAELVYAKALPDHHTLDSRLLQSLLREAAGLKPELWVITEKDWVRLPKAIPDGMNLFVLTVKFDLGKDSFRFGALVRSALSAADRMNKDLG